MIQQSPLFTHYSYLCGPELIREPTGLYNLSGKSVDHVRGLIHKLMQEGGDDVTGELLARVPYANEVRNMKDLRNVIIYVENKKKKR